MSAQDSGNPDQKKILNLYAVLAATLLLSLVPHKMAALIVLVFFTGLLIGAYRLRKTAAPESLLENHMTFLIRTIWISGLLGAATTAAAASYMLGDLNYLPLNECAEALASRGAEALESMGQSEIMKAAEPCMAEFWDSNKKLLYTGGALSAGPVMLYMIYRLAKGLSRALKAYRVANPKSWL